MNHVHKPIVFMLMSTLSLSVTGLLAKQLSEALSVTMFSFLRFFLPALILLLVLIPKGIKLPKSTELKPTLLRALCIGLSQLCFIASLQTLTLVESVVLFATGPLFMPVIEKLVWHGKIRASTVFGIVMAFSGVVLLAGTEGEFTLRYDLLLGLAGGLFNSGSQLTLYKVSKSNMSPLEINFWAFSFAALFILPLALINDGSGLLGAHSFSLSVEPSVLWLLVMSMLIINTQVFRAKAYQLASSGSQLAPLIFTNLLFTAVWQSLFFADVMSRTQIAGMGLIVLATVLNGCWDVLVKHHQSKALQTRTS
ncbi:DMT family transporter [Vibrio parahaemolyticus]|uniref:EamA domain-containing protein n=2 Tax=Vibrionaceae TaxID=641 RepID=A0AAW3IS67_VIBPH|nr:DMT family transporter [Vibrio parahaemolyticus]EFO46914.1 putative membrane protein [Vibrio parahaemolyticus AQ4037]KIT39974.1 membrane protein [Vibrio parahaemolyticus 49]KIT43703.1 membrane protein [Vibrio parahaemolyticus 3644]KIT55154.1 membrane protein [Vibrio parahaemolyticus EN9701121]KIT59060.1 membrane protein [Vibrio parahaemolyticus EN9701072]NVJ67326.1 DMT family transporter [Gammaproteobacteria bacterium]PWF66851.1 EamA/RhaT family transporter [Vibrio sp. T21]